MPFFVAIIVLFILAALGIWVYFSQTAKGRQQDVHGDLEEANLQSNLVDTLEKTRKVQGDLHKRVEKLRN